MRACLLLHDLKPSGGVRVAVSHARALAESGWEVELVVTAGGRPEAFEGLPTRSLEQARASTYDWAIATWWETAAALYELRARRRLILLQSFEERFYRPEETYERQAAAAALRLPVDFVVISEWMAAVLSELRPDARLRVVRNGVDKAVFGVQRRSPGAGPLRVLVEGQPTLWFKGVEQALEAVRAMREPVELTVVSLDPESAQIEADRVVGGLSPASMAELYAHSDVLLKLSRIEGLPLPLLEAAQAGVPAIVTPFGAHSEVVEHGRNGFVVGYDDIPGAARLLDLLATDRALLERLGNAALATAQDWPGTADSSTAFVAALEELDELPPPEPGPALAGLLATLRFHQETSRTLPVPDRLLATQTELARAQALVHELSASRDDCAEMLNEARGELERIRARLPYRVAAGARRALRRDRS